MKKDKINILLAKKAYDIFKKYESYSRIQKTLKVTFSEACFLKSEYGKFLTIKNRKKIPYKYKKTLQGRDFVRETVRKRDKHTCQNKKCGKKWIIGQRRFDVHHLNGMCGKKSRGYDKISEIIGLITLCHKCHYNRPEHRCKSKTFRKNLTKKESIVVI